MKFEDIKVIGISGAGTMGSGIAQIFAKKGYQVIVSDIKEEFLDKSKNLIKVFNSSLLEEGLMTKEEEEKVYENIKFTTNVQDFKDTDIVIEAIVEKLDIKQNYWKEIESLSQDQIQFLQPTHQALV